MSISFVGIFIVIFVLVFVIYGWKIGLVKAVFDLLSFFLVGILTWLLYPSVSKLLISTPFYKIVHNWITMTLKDNDLIAKALPNFFEDMPPFLKESVMVSSKQTFDSLIGSAADALTVLTINAVCIIGLFIALSLLSLAIRKLGKFINKIIVIGPVNMILGGFFGLVQGVFLCYLIIMIVSYFPTSKVYEFVALDMEKSYVCKIMYNDNVKIFGLEPIHPVIRGE